MNLVTLLAERAALHPERPALIDSIAGRDRVVSYGELLRRVAAGSGLMRDRGLRRGDVILVFQPVSIELYEILLSAFHSGVRVMLADPSAGRGFLSDCCRRLMPDAFFGPWKAHCLRWLVPGMRGIGQSFVCGLWFPGATVWTSGVDGVPIMELPDDEPALITFTSGSTGLPKAAVRTHGFLLAQHQVLSRSLAFEGGEVDLITLPVFVLANLASGLTSVLAATDLARPGSPDVAAVRSQCRRHDATRCAAAPAFFEGFLKSAEGLPPFEKVFTGGAPVFPDLLVRLRKALPDSVVHAVYGSTEAEPIAHFSADDATSDTGLLTRSGGGLCAGKPVSEIRLMVIADRWGEALGPMGWEDFRRMELSNNEAGEIVVAGAHVLRGYLEGLGDCETKIRVDDGVWHRTGDAGWLDDQGRVWLLGRCAEKLPPYPSAAGLPEEALRYPFAIECALREEFPEIRMAAIEWKGRRTLVVGKSCDADLTKSIRMLAEPLGVRDLVCLNSLPLDRRHNSKIDYPSLRRALERI